LVARAAIADELLLRGSKDREGKSNRALGTALSWPDVAYGREGARVGVTYANDVNAGIVSPGFTLTENNLARFDDSVRASVRAGTPLRRLSVPEDVAAAVLLLGSPANGNITGAYLPVAGGID
jgi:NAD(P)-dependent dehydrogenase (short-subunit alcohol dehydrogenase family)